MDRWARWQPEPPKRSEQPEVATVLARWDARAWVASACSRVVEASPRWVLGRAVEPRAHLDEPMKRDLWSFRTQVRVPVATESATRADSVWKPAEPARKESLRAR